MPHLLGVHRGDTSVVACALLLILLLLSSVLAQGLSSGSVCSNKDISIFQGRTGSTEGIPQFSVQISNNCKSCDPWDIHVFCGWFASARMVSVNKFKRIDYNNCLVNGGKALRYGEILTFTYANSDMYPMRLKSASFCR